jgi:hypothetical protein
VLEVVLISMGVFLGLAGEQWRESAHHRELAEDALRRFRTELTANRRAVAAVRDYHVTLKKALDAHLSRPAGHREKFSATIHGLEPASFEQTAWDLAIATQSLTYIDPQLAYSLAQVYNLQQRYLELSHGILQAMYIRPPDENFEAFLETMAVYYGDIVIYEPGLLRQYDDLLPRVDRALR